MLLRDDEPVELADVARRYRLVEKMLPGGRGTAAVSGDGRGLPKSAPALLEFVAVRVLPEHVDDLGLGAGANEDELGRAAGVGLG